MKFVARTAHGVLSEQKFLLKKSVSLLEEKTDSRSPVIVEFLKK